MDILREAAGAGSAVASFFFLWAAIRPHVPFDFGSYVAKFITRLFNYLDPYMVVQIDERGGDRFKRSDAFVAVKFYLAAASSLTAKRLKAEMGSNKSNDILISMDEHQQVADRFHGAELQWSFHKKVLSGPPGAIRLSFSRQEQEQEQEKRYYRLKFHKRHRQLVIGRYLSHVIEEGRANKVRNRQRKLYTNTSYCWTHVSFNHPATFETLAMDPEKKAEIIDDLTGFSRSKDYYRKIGKAWKRGYLLYGPPGTGKSTMIAAMANLLEYDVYDLELTSVKDNTQLRRLLIEVADKSIIVMEDIDCSLDETSVRRADKTAGKSSDDEKSDSKSAEREGKSKVTLSGLLNFIDGIWSALGEERIIVVTNNHVEKLEPALVRRGRMDKHVELSYCSFEGFKVLARNYLGLDSHPRFGAIRELIGEARITPADVAERLLPKSVGLPTEENAEECLGKLIEAMQAAKTEGSLKPKEETGVELLL